MSAKVKSIPDGFHTVTPYLTVREAAKAIEFYKRAFGAQERYRLPMQDGKIGHAELQIGNSIVMLADEFPEFGNQSPQALNGSPVGFAIYVEDADKAFKRAIDAGATVKEPVGDKFYGERSGTVTDPYGHKWTLMTHIEDVSPEEMKKRMDEFMAKMGSEGSGSAKK
jgi:PhnB protein